jgi:hypothetical protein
VLAVLDFSFEGHGAPFLSQVIFRDLASCRSDNVAGNGVCFGPSFPSFCLDEVHVNAMPPRHPL